MLAWSCNYKLYSRDYKMRDNKSDKQKTTNISLRIPEEYRKRLQLQADNKGISFNAHVLRIIEIHMMGSGFGPS